MEERITTEDEKFWGVKPEEEITSIYHGLDFEGKLFIGEVLDALTTKADKYERDVIGYLNDALEVYRK